MKVPSRRAGAALALAITLVALLGCSDGRKPVYPVHGQVQWKGKPPVGAQVVFHPAGEAAREAVTPSGQVDSNGNFTLTTYAAGDGAPAGDYHVTIEWWVSPGDDLPAVNKLPAAYGKTASSRLTATVTAGDNTIPAFNLK